MTRRFVTLDVFTGAALAGNPLAVVFDAEGLDDQRMQAIAREFNLSETVFVLPPDDSRHRAALRIFTPQRELAFAGHPTVGAAAALALAENIKDQVFGLEERAGIVPCVVERRGEGRAFARFRAPQAPSRIEGAPRPEAAAAALGLDVDEIGETARWSAGLGWDFVEVASLEALARARPGAGFAEAFAAHPGAYLFYRVEDWTVWRARAFAPGAGVLEDPATGSAAAAFAGLVHRRVRPEDGDYDIVVEQGVEMGRPSRINVQLICRGNTLEGVEIGGEAVVVSEGRLRL
jgi:trans-2,3-dihydro-3-hydroxyanthranilate isomerase